MVDPDRLQVLLSRVTHRLRTLDTYAGEDPAALVNDEVRVANLERLDDLRGVVRAMTALL